MSQPLVNPNSKQPKEKKPDSRQWYQKKRWILPLGFFVVSAIAGALGGDGDSSSNPMPETSQTQVVEEAETAPESPAEAPIARDLVVPEMAGLNLSDALDELLAQGFTEASGQDASYEERVVLLTSNWIVCEMRPESGSTMSSDRTLVLLSVKNSEVCPGQAAADSAEEPATSGTTAAVDSRFGNQTSEQLSMLSTIADFLPTYDAASNDLQRGNIRLERDEAICKALGGSSKVTNWSGVVEDLGATSEGFAYLKVALARNITLETWNNEFSDIFDETLVERGSALYDTLLSLSEGQIVTFSGEFIEGDGACLDTKNLTEFFSMNRPEFIFRFTAIQP